MESTWNFSPINEKTAKIMSPESETRVTGQTIDSIRQQLEIMETYKNYVRSECLEQTLTAIKNHEKAKTRLNFRKITNSSIPELSRHIKTFPSRSCDYSIGGILMWTDYFNYEMTIFESTLFIKGYDKDLNSLIYYEPLGPMNKEDAYSIIQKDAEMSGGNAVMISGVETMTDTTSSHKASSGKYCDKWMEYLYDIDRFLHFSGKRMEKKRNHLNYFIKHYPDYQVETISEKNINEILEFTRRFGEKHIDSNLFNYENHQTLNVLNKYGEYTFEGLLVRIDGNVTGYTFGEKNDDTFFVHVEKGNIRFQGVYQALASSLAQYVNKKYPDVKYLNREEDMGNKALRKSKESYHPSLLINKKLINLK